MGFPPWSRGPFLLIYLILYFRFHVTTTDTLTSLLILPPLSFEGPTSKLTLTKLTGYIHENGPEGC